MAKAKKSLGGSILETIKTIVYALILAGIFRSLFFQPFWIPSGSMKDTLLIGDFLFVNKMAYGYSYASCPSIIIPRFGINVETDGVVFSNHANNLDCYYNDTTATLGKIITINKNFKILAWSIGYKIMKKREDLKVI